LRPYNVDTITEHIQKDLPPPVIHDRVEEYEVKHILDSQMFRGKPEYLVCWKGMVLKKMNGDQWNMSKGQNGS